MDIYNILQCVLYLDNPSCTCEFVHNDYVDVDKICKNGKIREIFVFHNAFRNLFGCPPSFKIVRIYASGNVRNFHDFVKEHWSFLPSCRIRLVYSNSVLSMKDQFDVNGEILTNLRHFSTHKDENGMVSMFMKTFRTKEEWNKVNDELHKTLFNWYNMYRCVTSSCVISYAEQKPYDSSILNVIADYIGTKIHVFNTDITSAVHVIQKSSHLLHPLKLYSNIVELYDDCIKVKNFTFTRINHCTLRDELLLQLLKSVNDEKTNLFWNHVICLWNAMGEAEPFAPDYNDAPAIVAIESRKNPLTIMSCLLSCNYLDKTKWRGIVFFCNHAHVEYYKEHLGTIVYKIIPLDELSISHFTLDDYNNLLKSPKIWDVFTTMAVQKIMTVQDDGFLIRLGAERFIEYDYVGAPWIGGRIYNEEGVGNGGLSIRNVQAMRQISIQFDAKERLFNMFTQTPEDVFFSKNISSIGYKLCPGNIASHFSSEQVLTKGCCGIHKPWAYMSASQLCTLFSNK
jgi:hypothetical protein